jgi:hypothetical protein
MKMRVVHPRILSIQLTEKTTPFSLFIHVFVESRHHLATRALLSKRIHFMLTRNLHSQDAFSTYAYPRVHEKNIVCTAENVCGPVKTLSILSILF